jgi:hypothetical protein
MQPGSQYRWVYFALGGALLVVVALGLVFGSPEASGGGRPDQIEAVSPEPGETVVRQTAIEVDVPAGYAIDLFVDNLLIPAGELFFVEGTGVYSWQPRPGGIIAELAPGPHTVLVRWRTLSGLPDEGEYSWTFRTY